MSTTTAVPFIIHKTSDEATMPTPDGLMSMFQTNRRAVMLSVSHDLFDGEGTLRLGLREKEVSAELFEQVREAMTAEAKTNG